MGLWDFRQALIQARNCLLNAFTFCQFFVSYWPPAISGVVCQFNSQFRLSFFHEEKREQLFQRLPSALRTHSPKPTLAPLFIGRHGAFWRDLPPGSSPNVGLPGRRSCADGPGL